MQKVTVGSMVPVANNPPASEDKLSANVQFEILGEDSFENIPPPRVDESSNISSRYFQIYYSLQ